MRLREGLRQALGEALGRRLGAARVQAVAGGSIHRALIIEDAGGRCFVKLADAGSSDILEAEADGLRALAECGAIRVPAVLGLGREGPDAFLVLEAFDLAASGDEAELGRAIAKLHACTGERYGWTRDNYIGATPQHNDMDADWTRFFREARLRPQLELARARGHGGRLYESGLRLCEGLEDLLAGHQPAASLLHGDLWSGNAGFLRDGTPVIFDPALYRGDAESDLAMTELFGGFGPRFYAAYGAARPLDPGYAVRKQIYQLYHVLNHANLFGGGYAAQAGAMIARLLARLPA
ncbi:MAG: fructosamine kinase family protein [Rhodocyclaceae bacterium]